MCIRDSILCVLKHCGIFCPPLWIRPVERSNPCTWFWRQTRTLRNQYDAHAQLFMLRTPLVLSFPGCAHTLITRFTTQHWQLTVSGESKWYSWRAKIAPYVLTGYALFNRGTACAYIVLFKNLVSTSEFLTVSYTSRVKRQLLSSTFWIRW